MTCIRPTGPPPARPSWPRSSRCAARSMPTPKSAIDCPRTTAKLRPRSPACRSKSTNRHRPPGSSRSCAAAATTGRTVLLRGDMDALPMPEETGLDFASPIPGRDARLRARHAFARCWSARPARCRARKDELARHRRLHVPARRRRPSRRALHDRGRAARRSRARGCVRAPYRPQHAAPARSHAAKGRCSPRPTRSTSPQGRGGTRRCRTTPRPDSGRLRDRHRTEGVIARRIPATDPAVLSITKIEAGRPIISCPAR